MYRRVTISNQWRTKSRKEVSKEAEGPWEGCKVRGRTQSGELKSPFLPLPPGFLQQFKNVQYQVREADVDKAIWWKAGLDKYLKSSLNVTEDQGTKSLPSAGGMGGCSNGDGESQAGSWTMSKTVTAGVAILCRSSHGSNDDCIGNQTQLIHQTENFTLLVHL